LGKNIGAQQPNAPDIGAYELTPVVGVSITPALDTIAIAGEAVTLSAPFVISPPDRDTIAIAGQAVTVASAKLIANITTAIFSIAGQGVAVAVGAANQALTDLWMTYLAGQGFTQDGFNSRLRAGFISNASITTDVTLADAIHIYFNQQGISSGTTQDRMLEFLDTNFPTLTGSLTDKLFATLQNNEFFV